MQRAAFAKITTLPLLIGRHLSKYLVLIIGSYNKFTIRLVLSVLLYLQLWTERSEGLGHEVTFKEEIHRFGAVP